MLLSKERLVQINISENPLYGELTLKVPAVAEEIQYFRTITFDSGKNDEADVRYRLGEALGKCWDQESALDLNFRALGTQPIEMISTS